MFAKAQRGQAEQRTSQQHKGQHGQPQQSHAGGQPQRHGKEQHPDLPGSAGGRAEPHQTERARHGYTGADVAVDQHDHQLHHGGQQRQRDRKAGTCFLPVTRHKGKADAQHQRDRRAQQKTLQSDRRTNYRFKHREKPPLR